ncbi:MAG: hypothetical protein IBJ09_13935 [Bacteroidia bacterium]|nr:hypothetical protein [Bacteroidia bacterium]
MKTKFGILILVTALAAGCASKKYTDLSEDDSYYSMADARREYRKEMQKQAQADQLSDSEQSVTNDDDSRTVIVNNNYYGNNYSTYRPWRYSSYGAGFAAGYAWGSSWGSPWSSWYGGPGYYGWNNWYGGGWCSPWHSPYYGWNNWYGGPGGYYSGWGNPYGYYGGGYGYGYGYGYGPGFYNYPYNPSPWYAPGAGGSAQTQSMVWGPKGNSGYVSNPNAVGGVGNTTFTGTIVKTADRGSAGKTPTGTAYTRPTTKTPGTVTAYTEHAGVTGRGGSVDRGAATPVRNNSGIGAEPASTGTTVGRTGSNGTTVNSSQTGRVYKPSAITEARPAADQGTGRTGSYNSGNAGSRTGSGNINTNSNGNSGRSGSNYTAPSNSNSNSGRTTPSYNSGSSNGSYNRGSVAPSNSGGSYNNGGSYNRGSVAPSNSGGSYNRGGSSGGSVSPSSGGSRSGSFGGGGGGVSTGGGGRR